MWTDWKRGGYWREFPGGAPSKSSGQFVTRGHSIGLWNGRCRGCPMRMIGFPNGCACCTWNWHEDVGQWLGTPLISRRRGESFPTRRWWFLVRGSRSANKIPDATPRLLEPAHAPMRPDVWHLIWARLWHDEVQRLSAAWHAEWMLQRTVEPAMLVTERSESWVEESVTFSHDRAFPLPRAWWSWGARSCRSA